MKYVTVAYFEDLQDNNHKYHRGDEYPREGLKVTKKRLTELASGKNLRGIPLIRLVDDEQQNK